MTPTKVLGTSKVSTGLRISLSKDAARSLGVSEGDYVIFVDDGRGNVVVKKAQ